MQFQEVQDSSFLVGVFMVVNESIYSSHNIVTWEFSVI